MISGMAWSVYILLVQGIQHLLFQSPSISLGSILSLWVGGLLLTIIVLAVTQVFRRNKRKWLISLLVNLTIILTISISLGSIRDDIQAHPPDVHPKKEVILDNGSKKVITKTMTKSALHIRYDLLPNYLIIIVIVHTVVAVQELNLEKLKRSQISEKLSKATLEALRAKLNPHFMFNALNTVSALIEEDPKEAQRVLEAFSFLLRNMVDKSSEQLSTVEEEIHFLKTYAAIEKRRFGEQLQIDFSIEEEVLSAKIPSLILQPLLENAIKHGRNKSDDQIHILISARQVASRLLLTLSDEGEGIQERESPSGAGLTITRERLNTLYGEDADFTITNKAPSGTIVTLNLPFD